jgi:adenosylhomocysteinase
MFEAARDMLAEGRGEELAPGLYAIPDRLDREVAARKLDTLGAAVDDLTDRQREYHEDWEHSDSAF